MYIIHNKTRNTTVQYEGSWPSKMLEKQLDKGDRLIVISLYSNTIKVPYEVEQYNVREWEWESFSLLKTHTTDF